MERLQPRYADHRIDGYTFYLDLDENELATEFPSSGIGGNRPPLALTVADACALRAFLTQPDVAAVLLTADLERQAEREQSQREGAELERQRIESGYYKR